MTFCVTRLLLALWFFITFSAGGMAFGQVLQDNVATIRPLHSIVSNIMAGIDAPKLLLKRHQDAHHASLRPSQIKMLNDADIVFRIGPGLEAFLNNILDDLAKTKTIISVINAPGVSVISNEHDVVDPHIWLSTKNALKIASAVKEELATQRKDKETNLEENYARFESRIIALGERLKLKLADARSYKYLAGHNALKYFADEFELNIQSVGLANEEFAPGARVISAFRNLAKSGEYDCLIVGAGGNSKSLRAIANDASLPVVVLDPMGSQFTEGSDQYFQLMDNLANQLASCHD